MSGDFRGAIININTSLQKAQQAINSGDPPFSSSEVRLTELLALLAADLGLVEEGKREDAEALAEATRIAVETAAQPRPNKKLLAGCLEAVRTSGHAVLETAPKIAATVNQIIDIIGKIHGTDSGGSSSS